jgi:hypothetical protein
MKYKRYLPIQIALILGLLVILLSLILKDDAVSVVIVIAFSLVGLFIIFFIVAQFITRLRQSIWLPLISSAVIVYTGLLVFSLSLPRFKSLIDQALPWNIPMVALGLAVVSFGWGLLMQIRPRPQDKMNGLGEETGKLVERMRGVSSKLSDLERKTDALIAQSDKLDALQSEISSLNTTIGLAKNQLKDLRETVSVMLDESYRLGKKLTSRGSEQDNID